MGVGAQTQAGFSVFTPLGGIPTGASAGASMGSSNLSMYSYPEAQRGFGGMQQGPRIDLTTGISIGEGVSVSLLGFGYPWAKVQRSKHRSFNAM